MEMFVQFLHWLVQRDRTKWYTFSKLDLGLMATSGLDWWTTGDSCIGFWLFIIAFNAVATYFHNKDQKGKNE